MKYFVISDIHGDLYALNSLLEKWNGRTKLLFIGDLISRNRYSYEVLITVKKLVEEGKAICLMGNHEYTFLGSLKKEDWAMNYVHTENNGYQTLMSFTKNILIKERLPYKDYSINEMIDLINKYCQEEIRFLESLPYYIEDNNYIFVHAAINHTVSKVEDTHFDIFLRGYVEFYNSDHKIPKTIVFGHLPTHNLNANNDIHIYNNGLKIAIDGGGCFPEKDASINALILDTRRKSQSILYYRYFSETKEVLSFEKILNK